MLGYRVAIFIVCCLSFVFGGNADSIIIHSEDSTYEFYNQYIDIFQPSKDIPFEEIVSVYSDSFFNHSRLNSHTLDLSKPTWARIKVEIKEDLRRDWLWELYDYRHRNISVYIPKDTSGFLKYEGGNAFPFSVKKYLHKNFVFELPHWKKGTYLIYYKIHSNHIGSLRGVFRTVKTFSQYAMYEYFFLALFYGVLLTLIIYNSLLFIASKDKIHVVYIAYVISAIGFALSRDGLGFQFIWPNVPVINSFSLNIFYYLIVVFTTLLSIVFLEIKNTNKVYYVILSILSVRTVSIILHVLFSIDISYSLFLDLFLFTIIFLLSISYLNIRSINRFFVLAYLFLYIAICIWELQHFGFVRHNFFTIYSMNIGILVESMILSLAIYDRIRLMRRTKEEVQKQMITVLEEKQYIEETYNTSLEQLVTKQKEELKNAVEEIHALNQQLNIQNKELRSKIEDIEKDNIVGKILTYSEFINIYNSQEKCLEVITEIKWADGYRCTKCDSLKFTLIKDTLARKCVKCKYTESPTKNTVLEGVKFPLNKAFYVIYILFFSRDKVTSTYLSKVMDLRQKTCWEFMEKVKLYKFDFKKQDGVSWLDIFAKE
ncbi:MAG: hypothetical protein MUE33_10410 [Cytophagaceae bacterium]|jgi:hypothetical protein|nr:hypothetical protein [Cytophagaceae bacterium]